MVEEAGIRYRMTSRDKAYWVTLAVMLGLLPIAIGLMVWGVDDLPLFGCCMSMLVMLGLSGVIAGLVWRTGSGFALNTKRLRWWKVECRRRRASIPLDEVRTISLHGGGESDWYMRLVTKDERKFKVPSICLGDRGREIAQFLKEHAPHIELDYKP